MRVVARHERRPRRPAVGSLAIRPGIPRAACGEPVDVWRMANFVAITRKRGGGKVVGNDEEDVVPFGRVRRSRAQYCRDGSNNNEYGLLHSHRLDLHRTRT